MTALLSKLNNKTLYVAKKKLMEMERSILVLCSYRNVLLLVV
jgi:hypothetical protein